MVVVCRAHGLLVINNKVGVYWLLTTKLEIDAVNKQTNYKANEW
jgi:hypothetical protein